MRALMLAGATIAALLATAAAADPVADLADGVGALNRHDNGAAVRLLSAALDSRMLSSADQEIALVRRAQAYLLLGRNADALSDAQQALAIQPGDVEAERVRNYAQNLDVPPPHGPIVNTDRPLNAAVAARNAAVNAELEASQANYQAALAATEAKRQADQRAYAAQMAAWQAGVQAQQAQAAAAQAAWQAQVKACKAGDRSQCAKP
jgi:tetratricopeptide (TPR) repeat protein